MPVPKLPEESDIWQEGALNLSQATPVLKELNLTSLSDAGRLKDSGKKAQTKTDSLGINLVISDLDKTLITVNTSFYFGKYLWKLGRLSSFKAWKLVLYYARYFLGILTPHALHQKSFEILFKGQPVSVFEELAFAFAQEIAREKTRNKVAAFIEEKKSEGAHLCLLSTGPDLLVKYFAALFGFDTFYGTSYGCDLAGNFSHVKKVIDGEGKAQIALKLKNLYKRTYALTDSIDDLPLLQVVSDPIAVNPGSRLKKEALSRNFSMLFDS